MTILNLAPLAALCLAVSALPSTLDHRATTPSLASAEVVGLVSDPTWNRDSCTSIGLFGRELWTCRDSQSSNAFISSSASWTDFNSSMLPKIDSAGVLEMYGDNSASEAYFPVQADECGPSAAGGCADGTRYAIWQDSRPMIAGNGSSSNAALYTWIRRSHISSDLSVLDPTPATSLYRSDYAMGLTSTQLPPVTLVNEYFWPQDSIPYGTYGWVQNGSYSYLYGLMTSVGSIALARVPTASVEDPAAYEYYTASGYVNTPPANDDFDAVVPNAGTGGQGTFYYSAYFKSYVWVGIGAIGCNADFYVATAPAPEGPWSTPARFYMGEVGTASCGAYSQQAHPELTNDDGLGNYIFVTYTKVDAGYSTPLIKITWVLVLNPGHDLVSLKQKMEALAASSPNCAEILSKYRNKGDVDQIGEIRVRWGGKDKQFFPKETLVTEENCEAVLRMLALKPGEDVLDVGLEKSFSGTGGKK
ncbi:hypothetical protein LTR62_008302 [Meristemomyces frigidus]|uniref:DUF4185 domain-containing protein n=1 Tax=Meristemomyces frigidus TaxID=1508187 RepID=A0AAN7TDN9_9PEZI|nr:hypothetical protein LTR62_008302 [Meristemomyces frigidus]